MGWEVANDRNWSQTAAIDVLLAVNFAVVFILMHFRFRQVNQNYYLHYTEIHKIFITGANIHGDIA